MVFAYIVPFGHHRQQAQNKLEEERNYSPYIPLTAEDGYLFFGLANTNVTVPQPLLRDPSLNYGPTEATTFMIARFSESPVGPVDLVWPPGFTCYHLFANSLRRMLEM
jgi:hypothetical protein